MWEQYRRLRKGRLLADLSLTNNNALELGLGGHTRVNRSFIYHSLRDANQMDNIAADLLKMLICLFGEFDHAPVVSVNRNVVMLSLAWHSRGSRSFKHHDSGSVRGLQPSSGLIDLILKGFELTIDWTKPGLIEDKFTSDSCVTRVS